MTTETSKRYSTVTPMIVFKDCKKAIEFYKKAFNAQEKVCLMLPDGSGVMHATIQIGNSMIMMSDEKAHCKSIETIGGSPINFYIYVDDVDSAFKKAINSGATETMPVQDMFWGDRCGQLKDQFGYLWMMATHKKDLTPEQISEAAKAFLCPN